MTLRRAATIGGELAGRMRLTLDLRARRGPDPEIDKRMAASSVYRDVMREAAEDWYVQSFIHTDLFSSGMLMFGQNVELTCAFPRALAAAQGDQVN